MEVQFEEVDQLVDRAELTFAILVSLRSDGNIFFPNRLERQMTQEKFPWISNASTETKWNPARRGIFLGDKPEVNNSSLLLVRHVFSLMRIHVVFVIHKIVDVHPHRHRVSRENFVQIIVNLQNRAEMFNLKTIR